MALSEYKVNTARPGLPAPTEAHAPLLLRLKDYPSNHTAPWDPSPVNEGVRHAMGPEQVLRTMGEIISSLTISGCLALVDN